MSDDPKPSHFWPPPEHPPDELLPDPTFKETFRRWWRQGLAYWIFVVFSLLECGLVVFVLLYVGTPDVMHEDDGVRNSLARFREPPQYFAWYPIGWVSLIAGTIYSHVLFVRLARRRNWCPDLRGVAANGLVWIILGLVFGWVGGTGERLVNSLWTVSYQDRSAFVTITGVAFTDTWGEPSDYGDLVFVMNFADGSKRMLLADWITGPIKRWDCVRYRERVGILGIAFARRPLWQKTLTRIDCPDSVEALRAQQKAIFDSLSRPVVKPWYLE